MGTKTDLIHKFELPDDLLMTEVLNLQESPKRGDSEDQYKDLTYMYSQKASFCYSKAMKYDQKQMDPQLMSILQFIPKLIL